MITGQQQQDIERKSQLTKTPLNKAREQLRSTQGPFLDEYKMQRDIDDYKEKQNKAIYKQNLRIMGYDTPPPSMEEMSMIPRGWT